MKVVTINNFQIFDKVLPKQEYLEKKNLLKCNLNIFMDNWISFKKSLFLRIKTHLSAQQITF